MIELRKGYYNSKKWRCGLNQVLRFNLFFKIRDKDKMFAIRNPKNSENKYLIIDVDGDLNIRNEEINNHECIVYKTTSGTGYRCIFELESPINDYTYWKYVFNMMKKNPNIDKNSTNAKWWFTLPSHYEPYLCNEGKTKLAIINEQTVNTEQRGTQYTDYTTNFRIEDYVDYIIGIEPYKNSQTIFQHVGKNKPQIQIYNNKLHNFNTKYNWEWIDENNILNHLNEEGVEKYLSGV